MDGKVTDSGQKGRTGQCKTVDGMGGTAKNSEW